MKRFVLFMLVLLNTSFVCAGGEQSTQDQIMASIRGRLAAAARNDTDAWSHFVSDELIVPLEGEMKAKSAWMQMHDAFPPGVKYWYGPLEDVKVRLFGDTAVVVYHAKQFTEIGGQTTFVHKWQIETLIHKDRQWLLAAVADGLIFPEPKIAEVDPKLYDTYAGKYQWAPNLISTVMREGDKLIEEFSGQGKSELLPENETTFFIKGEAETGDSSRIIFVKDSSGRVTHYIYREMGATDRIVKKIN